jgi:zinc transporter, ZIP family
MNNLWIMALIAALGPIVGSLIGVLRKPTDRFMYNLLSFAAGVMLSISFLQLIPESIKLSSELACLIGLVAGSLAMYAVDRLLPHVHPGLCAPENSSDLQRTATFLLVGISLHNIPEGMAIGIASTLESRFSLTISIAIALQKIPEGICTSAPYFHTTGRRWRAFLISSLTTVPVLIGFFAMRALSQRLGPWLIGLIMAGTSGLMIYISADELIPTSAGKTGDHSVIFSLIAGVLVVIALRMLY